MGRINVLDKHTAELIAAGEVVERPSSVVKELLENSIDAGADNITVEIQHGGIDFLRITDNGHGILREDVRNAFKRNATSKIAVESDLEKIGTLGFRGEALASISSVSKVQLITKAIEEEVGTAFEINGGEEISFKDAGCPNGTTFIMRDLFYNVPARYKFLKKDVSEGNAVAGVIDKIALSHPDIAITFIRDGKQALKTSGDGKLLSAIYSVYGRDFANSLIPVDYELNGMKLTGYASKPANGRANRNMQNTFINGRFVKSKTMSVALDEAFRGSIIVGKFPSSVLNLEISPEAVDVNVHPSKIEVRFVNERPVFDIVYHGIKSALLRNDTRKEAIINTPARESVKRVNPFELAGKVIDQSQVKTEKPIAPQHKDNTVEQHSVFEELDVPKSSSKKPFNSVFTGKNTVSDSNIAKKNYYSFVTDVSAKPNADEEINADNSAKEEIKPAENIVKNVETVSENIEKSEEKTVEVIKPNYLPKQENYEIKTLIDEDKKSFRFIGEAMNTYIIVETDNNKLVLIDKHAAHERIIFEKLKKEQGNGIAQMLLMPVTVTLEKNEYSVAIENIDLFNEVGFEVEDFGNSSIIVRSAPSYLRNDDIQDTVIEICTHIADNRKVIISEHMEWIYHNISCRSAIKAGNKSTAEELIDIAQKVFSDDNIRYCPHGRPVCIELSKYEIEKQFGRV